MWYLKHFQIPIPSEFLILYTSKLAQTSLARYVGIKKSLSQSERDLEVFGGFERIRTAVRGFADHCLATRPRNPLRATKVQTIEYCATKKCFISNALEN